MKQLFLVLSMIVFSALDPSGLQAQERGKDSTVPATKLTESPQFQSKVNSRDAQTGRADGAGQLKSPAIPLARGEKEHVIKSYRIDYKANPMSNPDNLIASMLLFNAQDEQVGLLNFHAAASKALAAKETVNEKGLVTLSYPIELMDKVVEFITRTPQSVLVYNIEAKTAYLTMSVLPIRGR